MRRIEYYIEEKDYKLYIDGHLVEDSFSKYLSNLASDNFKSVLFIRKSAKKILNIERNIPLYINKNTLLLPISGLKNNNPLMINYYGISNYFLRKNGIYIIFKNTSTVLVNISKYRFERLMKNAEIINDYISLFD